MKYTIIYENDTELAALEAQARGCRRDITVVIGEKKYRVLVISMIRLQQDYETEKRDMGFYLAEPNTLIVEEVTKEDIEKIVAKMFACKYFEKLDRLGF